MKHSSLYIKWFSRSLLLISLLVMAYVATKPNYNLAHWVPHGFLRQLGLPYSFVLHAEQNLDKALHFFGAALLTFLIIKSNFTFLNEQQILCLVIALCFAAELVQLLIGRSFNSIDLLLGFSGSFMAYLGITQNRHKSA